VRTDSPDEARLEAWRLLLMAHARLVDVLGDELEAAHGLPLTWYDVLVNLRAAPEHALRMNDLADAVLLSRSGLTRLVDRMTAAGLVERRTCASDRRGQLAALTPAGRAALRAAAPTHMRGVAEHFAAHVSEAEAAAMSAALTRVVDAASRRPGRAAACGEAGTDPAPVRASAGARR
jgi:DNA-binding MarR family transcriptional regulator